MIPSLEELRIQCRIDSDNTDEDSLLELYVSAAREEAEQFLNRRLYDDSVPEDDTTGIVITSSIKLRVMQLVNFWYDNRDQPEVVPDFFFNGIRSYRLQPGT